MKADLDAKTADPDRESVGWDLGSLRWAWNRAKNNVAPWWAENSKECYSSGLADLAQGLAIWKTSNNGARKGRRVKFPRFKSARRGAGRVRFTTGTMRPEDNRCTITVPVIGGAAVQGEHRRVQRHLAAGRAQILNMTLSQRWGRLFTARITPVVVQSAPGPHRHPGQPHRLVQAVARPPDRPAPAELAEVLTPVRPATARARPKPRKGKLRIPSHINTHILGDSRFGQRSRAPSA